MPFYTEDEFNEIKWALEDVRKQLQDVVIEGEGNYWCELTEVPDLLREVLEGTHD